MTLDEIKTSDSLVCAGENLALIEKQMRWLITELEKKRDVDLKSSAVWKVCERMTAIKCAELAAIFDHDGCFWNNTGAEAIIKEFRLDFKLEN